MLFSFQKHRFYFTPAQLEFGAKYDTFTDPRQEDLPINAALSEADTAAK